MTLVNCSCTREHYCLYPFRVIQFSDASCLSSADTCLPASYVEQKRTLFSLSLRKFLMICLMESVDNTVDIPSRVPNSDAKVLFPVPDVPANNTITLILDCIRREATKKSLRQSGFWYSFCLKQKSRISFNVLIDVVTFLITNWREPSGFTKHWTSSPELMDESNSCLDMNWSTLDWCEGSLRF